MRCLRKTGGLGNWSVAYESRHPTSKGRKTPLDQEVAVRDAKRLCEDRKTLLERITNAPLRGIMF